MTWKYHSHKLDDGRTVEDYLLMTDSNSASEWPSYHIPFTSIQSAAVHRVSPNKKWKCHINSIDEWMTEDEMDVEWNTKEEAKEAIEFAISDTLEKNILRRIK